MSEPTTIRKTPRIVDGAAHLPDRPPTEDELKYPLPAFFYEMRNVPFDEWTEFQVRRSVRQNLYVEHLIPRALAILKTEPLAGGYWTGDLLQLFTQIPGEYWEQHPNQKATAVEAAQAALNDALWTYLEEDEDEELKHIILSIASGTIPEKLD